MGSRRVPRHGKCSAKMARCSFWCLAKWLLGWLSSCGFGGVVGAARMGMAGYVLGGWSTRAARLLHTIEGQGVGSLETTSCPNGGRNHSCGQRPLENLFLSRAADDAHDVSLSRDAGFVSRLLEIGSPFHS